MLFYGLAAELFDYRVQTPITDNCHKMLQCVS